MSRALVLASVVALLMVSSSSVANPGGNGDSDRDYTCGGSCHGDPSMSLPSDGTISISQDGDVFAGHAVAVMSTSLGCPSLVTGCLERSS